MFCSKCGKENELGAKYCKACGAAIEIMVSKEKRHEKQLLMKKSMLIVIIALLILVGLIIVLIIMPKFNKKINGIYKENESKYQGEPKYEQEIEAEEFAAQEELEYEQALAEREAETEIFSEDKESYIALADLYTKENDYGAALLALQRGLENCKDEELAYYCVALSENEELDVVIRYDVRKSVVESARLEDGTLWDTYIEEYDTNGNVIRRTATYYFGSYEPTISYYTYEYDENGNAIKQIYCDEQWKVCEGRYDVYEYDENGNNVKDIIYVSDVVSSYCIYEYDENGNRTKRSYYASDGKLERSMSCEYDASGKLIKEDSSYKSDGSIASYYMYEYDKDGNVKKRTKYQEEFSGQGMVVRSYSTYEYDMDGNRIKWSEYNKHGDVTAYRTYEYDEDGKILKWQQYNPDGTINCMCEYETRPSVICWMVYNEDGVKIIENTLGETETLSHNQLTEDEIVLQEEIPFIQENFFNDEGQWWLCRISDIYRFDLQGEKCFNYDENLNIYQNHKYEWSTEADPIKHEWSYKYNPDIPAVTFYWDSSGYTTSYRVYNLGNGFAKFVDMDGEEILLYGTEEKFDGTGTWLALTHKIQDPNVRFLEFDKGSGLATENYFYVDEDSQSSSRTESVTYEYSEDNNILTIVKGDVTNTFHSMYQLESFHNAILAREEYYLSSPGHIEYLYDDYIMFRPLNSGSYVIEHMLEE